MSWVFCFPLEAKTWPSLRNAWITVPMGNCSNTAPKVPPKTMRAAVGCRIWPRLPPSISNPAMMPATASSTPPMLDASMFLPRRTCGSPQGKRSDRLCAGPGRPFRRNVAIAVQVEAGDGDDTLQIGDAGNPARHAGHQAGAVGKDSLDDFGAGFAHDELFAVDQGQHRIRRRLRGLDQVAVDHHRVAVEPGEFDHCIGAPLPN